MAFADIVPVLSAITLIPEVQVEEAYVEAWDQAKANNGNRSDTGTYVQTVAILRRELKFSLDELASAWRAKDTLDKLPPHQR